METTIKQSKSTNVDLRTIMKDARTFVAAANPTLVILLYTLILSKNMALRPMELTMLNTIQAEVVVAHAKLAFQMTNSRYRT